MFYCDYCESKLDDAVTSCPNCGAPVTRKETTYSYNETVEECSASDTEEGNGWDTVTTVTGALLGGMLMSAVRPMPRSRRPAAPVRHPIPTGGAPARHPRPGMSAHRHHTGPDMRAFGGAGRGPGRGSGRGPGGPGGRR